MVLKTRKLSVKTVCRPSMIKYSVTFFANKDSAAKENICKTSYLVIRVMDAGAKITIVMLKPF